MIPSHSRHAFVALALCSAVATLCAAVGPATAAAQSPHGAPGPESIAAPPDVEEGIDYLVYERSGAPTTLSDIVSSVMGDEVLLVGEQHDDMVGHAVETLLLQAVFDRIGSAEGAGRTVVLSLEMFERDVQYVLDEYLGGLITEDHFLRSSRPWDDYDARYRPLVEAARAHAAPVVAANAPRRYVNRVTNQGPESLAGLSAHARSYLPPLPFPGPSVAYREQWEAIMTAAMLGAAESDQGADRSYAPNPNAIYAQALWDAAMGHAITEALVRHIGGFVVHFAGSFHVERGTGIPERIADYRPGTRVTSVVMTKVDDIHEWSADRHGPLADFVVLTRRPPTPGDASVR